MGGGGGGIFCQRQPAVFLLHSKNIWKQREKHAVRVKKSKDSHCEFSERMEAYSENTRKVIRWPYKENTSNYRLLVLHKILFKDFKKNSNIFFLGQRVRNPDYFFLITVPVLKIVR